MLLFHEYAQAFSMAHSQDLNITAEEQRIGLDAKGKGFSTAQNYFVAMGKHKHLEFTIDDNC